ncbi:MAG: carboxypeptidase-like regulatory domain-containing protein [Fulvivirga sp.]
MLKINIFITIALLLINYNVKAQESFITIKGKVIDSETKQALPFASIYIKEESIGTTSSSDGSFIFHIPYAIRSKTVVISTIGYETMEKVSSEFAANEEIHLKPSTLELSEVIVTADKPPTARQIVKLAHQAIGSNYPSEPYMLEGFVRDLEKEDEKYVELLEYAAKFLYQGYKYTPKVELQEVRKSFETEKHAWNTGNEQQNSIGDLIEDDFIKYEFSFIKGSRRWKYDIESILPFNNGAVYKIIGVNPPFEKVNLYIDVNTYAFVKIELNRSKINGKYYKRRFTNGQHEANYTMVFEYQKIKGQMYLKYQKEVDTWDIFKGLESGKLLFVKQFTKELFVNKIITDNVSDYPFNKNLKTTETIESQAKSYNPEFWANYNVPSQTKLESQILKELEKASIKID